MIYRYSRRGYHRIYSQEIHTRARQCKGKRIISPIKIVQILTEIPHSLLRLGASFLLFEFYIILCRNATLSISLIISSEKKNAPIGKDRAHSARERRDKGEWTEVLECWSNGVMFQRNSFGGEMENGERQFAPKASLWEYLKFEMV
jgi:hypothetical protein